LERSTDRTPETICLFPSVDWKVRWTRYASKGIDDVYLVQERRFDLFFTDPLENLGIGLLVEPGDDSRFIFESYDYSKHVPPWKRPRILLARKVRRPGRFGLSSFVRCYPSFQRCIEYEERLEPDGLNLLESILALLASFVAVSSFRPPSIAL
jgi:hypothetical protein